MGGKLVRDKIPEIIARESGTMPEVCVLTAGEMIVALKRKLIEESNELLQAVENAKIHEELADVSETFDELCVSLRVSRSELEFLKKEKRALKGGFKKRLFMTT